MRIRWKISVAGMVHNNADGVRAGDIMDIDDESATHYIVLGYAEKVAQRGEEHAVAHSVKEEHAVMPKVEPEPVKPVYGETHPPEDAPAPATKRGPGRPRKV